MPGHVPVPRELLQLAHEPASVSAAFPGLLAALLGLFSCFGLFAHGEPLAAGSRRSSSGRVRDRRHLLSDGGQLIVDQHQRLPPTWRTRGPGFGCLRPDQWSHSADRAGRSRRGRVDLLRLLQKGPASTPSRTSAADRAQARSRCWCCGPTALSACWRWRLHHPSRPR